MYRYTYIYIDTDRMILIMLIKPMPSNGYRDVDLLDVLITTMDLDGC